MPFCSKCGTKNDDGVNFCVSCGAPLQGAAPQTPQMDPQMQAMMMQQMMMQQQQMGGMQALAQQRQESLNEMDRMISYFGQKQNEYDEYDYLNDLIPRQMYVKAKPMLVFGIISTVLSFILFGAGGGAAGAGAVFLIIGLGLIGGFIALNVVRKNKLNANLDRVAILANELAEHYAGYGMCLVGAEYSNPRILLAIRDAITAGRADTPKEAINVLLDDNHKSNMEALATQTAVNSAAAARGANTAAAFAAASFFFN